MIAILSKALYFFSQIQMMPPSRRLQIEVMDNAEKKNKNKDFFLRNSLCQYYCHSKFFKSYIWLIYQIVSVFAVPVLLIYLCLRRRPKHKVPTRFVSLIAKLPADVKNTYNPLYIKKPFGSIAKNDFKYIKKILLQSGFRPYFKLRTIWKIAIYSDIIAIYNPTAVLVNQEMTFESSLITNYLDDQGIKHINAMHGDKFFSIQDAFSSFDISYVWSDFYIQLFNNLKCSNKKYILFDALDGLRSTLPEKNIFKYYHQETKGPAEFLGVLKNIQEFVKQKQCDLAVRLHPAQKKPYEEKLLQDLGIPLETSAVKLIDSLSEAKFVCSEFSSVLYQASLLEKKLVIDNTNQPKIDILKDIDFVVFETMDYEFLIKGEETSRKQSV